MFGSKLYTGIVLEEGGLKVAQLAVDKNKLRIVKLDRFSLAEDLKYQQGKEQVFEESERETDEEAGEIFGLEDDDDEIPDLSGELDEELNFDDLDEEIEEEQEEDAMALDMVDEAESAPSNEMVLYNALSSVDPSKVNLGLNVPAGNTIFQIIRDTNFKEVKKKDLIADLEEKLESIYGVRKSEDNYSYEIKDDGSLVLASIDEEPALLKLINRSMQFYTGKVTIEEILPDEVLLVGLVRANYYLNKDEITGILQLGPKRCRIVFLQGNEIWLISPIINEGTKDKGFLNTVFSKILFQLDTGEVPNLDRLIIANNSIGDEATQFFQKNFPDIAVEEFKFNERHLSYREEDEDIVNGFTTAIGAAWAAAGFQNNKFPDLSLVPSYVHDRQKIFQLQWHGIILLLLIGLSPITFNYFYQQNTNKIDNMNSELGRINTQIEQLNPTVESSNQISDDLALLREKLVLLDTLSRGTKEWTEKYNIINQGMRAVGSSWFTSMNFSQEGVFFEGYTLYRNRVPQIVDIFKDATLLSVIVDELREKEIYRFTILVKEFARDVSIYSPSRPDDLKEVLAN